MLVFIIERLLQTKIIVFSLVLLHLFLSRPVARLLRSLRGRNRETNKDLEEVRMKRVELNPTVWSLRSSVFECLRGFLVQARKYEVLASERQGVFINAHGVVAASAVKCANG